MFISLPTSRVTLKCDHRLHHPAWSATTQAKAKNVSVYFACISCTGCLSVCLSVCPSVCLPVFLSLTHTHTHTHDDKRKNYIEVYDGFHMIVVMMKTR